MLIVCGKGRRTRVNGKPCQGHVAAVIEGKGQPTLSGMRHSNAARDCEKDAGCAHAFDFPAPQKPFLIRISCAEPLACRRASCEHQVPGGQHRKILDPAWHGRFRRGNPVVEMKGLALHSDIADEIAP